MKFVFFKSLKTASMTSISRDTRNIFGSFPMIYVNCHHVHLVLYFPWRLCAPLAIKRMTKCFFNPLSSPLSLSFSLQHPSKTLQAILQLRARPISSSERKHLTVHSSQKNNYILLYVALLPLCKHTAYPR